jgi:predicted metal-dependent hydrolase
MLNPVIFCARFACIHTTSPTQDAQLFFKQEGMHTHVHEAWNERIEREHGHPMAAIDDMIANSLKRMQRWMSPLNQLAFTVCLEHFTSGFGHLLLESAAGEETLAQAAEPQRSLWVWHAVEELEHKCVAIDVYNAMGGGYFRRAGDCVK